MRMRTEDELRRRTYARLEEAAVQREETLQRSKVEETDRLEEIGLKYKLGTKVFDKVSGKKGEILDGTREVIRIQVPREKRGKGIFGTP